MNPLDSVVRLLNDEMKLAQPQAFDTPLVISSVVSVLNHDSFPERKLKIIELDSSCLALGSQVIYEHMTTYILLYVLMMTVGYLILYHHRELSANTFFQDVGDSEPTLQTKISSLLLRFKNDNDNRTSGILIYMSHLDSYAQN